MEKMVTTVEEKIKALFDLIKKNEDALGKEKDNPKYKKAFDKKYSEAVLLARELYTDGVTRLLIENNKEGLAQYHFRNRLAKRDSKKITDACRKKDLSLLIKIVSKATCEATDNWYKFYFPYHPYGGGKPEVKKC